MSEEISITGDLNFQLDDATNNNVRRFSGQLGAHGLIQHAAGANHIRGNTLEVVITRAVSCIIRGMLSVVDPCLNGIKGSRSGIYMALDCT